MSLLRALLTNVAFLLASGAVTGVVAVLLLYVSGESAIPSQLALAVTFYAVFFLLHGLNEYRLRGAEEGDSVESTLENV